MGNSFILTDKHYNILTDTQGNKPVSPMDKDFLRIPGTE